jgi:hypothetical protein
MTFQSKELKILDYNILQKCVVLYEANVALLASEFLNAVLLVLEPHCNSIQGFYFAHIVLLNLFYHLVVPLVSHER